MSEFARLLKDAAGQPPRPFHMAAIRERAARLGWRRRVGVWLSAALAILGIGVPTGVSLVPSNDGLEGVRVIDSDGGARQLSPADATPDPGGGERAATDIRDRVVTGSEGASPTRPPHATQATIPGVGRSGGFEHVAALGLIGKLAYTGPTAAGAAFEIQLLDLATGREEALRSGVSPAFSPDGSQVAYIDVPAGVADRLGALRVIGADGGGDRHVHAFPDRSIDWPTWSPDGSQLAFLASQPGGGWPIFAGATGRSGIWVVNADGTGARELTQLSNPGAPEWAPDGGSLAWTDSKSGSDVHIYEFASGLTRRVAAGRSPAWAPDSKRLAVVRQVLEPQDPITGARPRRDVIDVVNVETNTIERSIGEESRGIYGPTWSPDGNWLAFLRPSADASTGGEIVVVRADGRKIAVVVSRATNTGYDGGPSWGRASSR